MPAKYKKRFKKIRSEFARDLIDECNKNNIVALAIWKNYTAYKHQKFVHKIHDVLSKDYHCRKVYRDKLAKSYLISNESVLTTLYFVNNEKFDKYKMIIPEDMAMGTAYGIALVFMRKLCSENIKNNKKTKIIKVENMEKYGKSKFEDAEKIDNWEQLANIKSINSEHTLEIDIKGCNGWIRHKNEKKLGIDYLSTHTFYGSNFQGATKLLNKYGFKVSLKNWDYEDK